MNESAKIAIVWIVIVLICVGLLFGLIWGWKNFKVWSRGQDGKAQLAEAEYNRKIQITEAEANLESEKLNALSEIERAKGAAEAIRIEGGTLTTQYIQYLWVRQNKFNDKTVIYIPTEANLPILEAGQR